MAAASLIVGAIALAGLGLVPKVVRMIRGRGEQLTAEVGTGDDPGARERGPEGIKM